MSIISTNTHPESRAAKPESSEKPLQLTACMSMLTNFREAMLRAILGHRSGRITREMDERARLFFQCLETGTPFIDPRLSCTEVSILTKPVNVLRTEETDQSPEISQKVAFVPASAGNSSALFTESGVY